MSFTLVIHPTRDRGGEEPTEKEFEQSHVFIGRGVGSDLVLKDPQRMISSRHAEIREQGKSWVLVDVGSTNGTKLNEARLTPNKEYVLRDGDNIAVGSFLLTFQTGKRSVAGGEAERSPAKSTTSLPAIVETDTDRLLYLVRRTYADAPSTEPGKEGKHLEAVVRQNIAKYDRTEAQALVVFVRDRLSSGPSAGGPLGKSERLAQPLLPSSKAVSSSKPSMPDDSTVPFPDLVRKFLRELDQPLSKSELDLVVRRVIRILEVVFAGLADAVKGRREFQKEFEVEATQILSWKPNPVKQAESAVEIGEILLSPRPKGLTEEQAADSLKEIFQDLTLHQLGLLAGFRECVRGLLKELDPLVIGKPANGETRGKGMGLLSGGNVRSEAAAWRRFIEKHRQLTEEEVKVFERILAPHFAKGYLSVHKTRRRS